MKQWLHYLSLIFINLIMLASGFYFGIVFYETHAEPQVIETIVYRYPNAQPYEKLDDPINFDQALILLQGMKASHVSALNWTFESDPGFGIADKEFQNWCIHAYDQLIEFIYRQERS